MFGTTVYELKSQRCGMFGSTIVCIYKHEESCMNPEEIRELLIAMLEINKQALDSIEKIVDMNETILDWLVNQSASTRTKT